MTSWVSEDIGSRGIIAVTEKGKAMNDLESAIKAAKEAAVEVEKRLNEWANKACEEIMKAWEEANEFRS